MGINYNDYVVKFSSRFKCVVIDASYVQKIHDFVSKLVLEKRKEKHHTIDSKNEVKRFLTGFLGEAALEQLLKIKIIDWSIGCSDLYHKPDIPGYRVGIKTVERNKFPIIFKKNQYPQIICIKSIDRDDVVFICGLADTNTLNMYQSDDLILDRNLRARGTKTGFYGFKYLTVINSLSDLEEYKLD